MQMPSDEQLLQRFARGHDAALAELAARYERALLGLALGITGDEALARDVVQDAWVRVIRSAKHFAGNSGVKTWLYRIVINRAIDLRQGAARTPAPLVGDGGGVESADPARRELRSLLSAAMRGLEPSQNLILLLCYHDGLSHPEAAAVLDIPVGTLKTRLRGAVAALRAALGAEVER
jgi:RNA polymerase sigma-70 factor, ECF subfamily